MLRELTIKNYRGFQEFYIDDLARVNLLVGSNNTGKTSLLEAIYLLVNKRGPKSLDVLQVQHSEIDAQPNQKKTYEITSLFHGYPVRPAQSIYINSGNDFAEIKLQTSRSGSEMEKLARRELRERFMNSNFPFYISFFYRYGNHWKELMVPLIENMLIDVDSDYFTENDNRGTKYSLNPKIGEFIPAGNISLYKLNLLWDSILCTSKEENVIKALQIIEPHTERIGFTSRQANNRIVLKLNKWNHPIPLSSMGSGMRHILMLAMAAVTVEGGILLVDEIETGLHYEAQTDMWRLILETAQELNVQVFATTHSWDCICAFQEALEQFGDNAIGKLYRLSRRDDKIKPVAYTGEDLDIAVRQSIEVR